MSFSVDSKIKDILRSPAARAALDSIMPGLADDPKLKLIQGKTVREASKMLPTFMPLILGRLDKVLAGLDDSGPVYDFDRIIDRAGTNSVKYEDKSDDGLLPDSYLPMWVADMDFASPKPILDAMKARIDREIMGYSMLSGDDYFSAVTSWMRRRHDWQVDPDSIVYSAGVVTAINVCVEKLTRPGDGVIINTPCYTPFFSAIKKHGRTPLYSPFINEGGHYRFDYEQFEALCADENAKLFFLCNPHNPTGRVFTAEELRRVADICFKNGVFVASDEIHFDILRPGQKHVPLATLYPGETRLLTCTAPSKTFNLAGNQLANIIIPDKALKEQWDNESWGGMPNPLAIVACRAAYDECADWVDAMNAYVAQNFDYIADYVAANMPQAKFTVSEGTYLAWLDLGGYDYSDDELKRRIATAGVYIEYAGDFVADAGGYVRINIACPRAVVQKAMPLIARALE